MSDPLPRLPDPRMIPEWEAPRHQRRAVDGPRAGSPAIAAGWDPPTESGPAPTPHGSATDDPADDLFVRPFLVTGGRTRPLRDGLRVETVVVAPPAALSAPLRFEAARIVQMCQQPMAVVDVAVALRLPLGVTKVLIGDLVTEGYLNCDVHGEITPSLLERIRDRVRAL